MKTTRNVRLAIWALALCSALFVTACGKRRGIEPPEAVLTNFVLESGPDEIGWSRHWVIRHKQSGERFIYTERSSGGIFLAPLATR